MGTNRTPGGTYGILVANQSIYDYSSTAKHALGTRLPMGDRVFYYGKAATTIAAGEVCSPDVSVGGPVLLPDAACVAIASPTLQSKAITAALAVGDRGIGITHGTYLDNITAHMLKDGYIVLTDSGGINQYYKIKDNTAAATDIVEILLYDEIRTATTDATTGVAVMCNLFNNLCPAVPASDECVAGVAMAAFTTTYPYGWFQTWGPGMVKVAGNGSTGVATACGGTDLSIGTVAGTADLTLSSGIVARIGYGLTDITTSGDAALVMLQILP
jgi:hypothetical protein